MAALDAERAPQWVAMMQRAVQVIRADRVLHVTHSREAQELADARTELGGSAHSASHRRVVLFEEEGATQQGFCEGVERCHQRRKRGR
jgi:hypothetical protein